MATLFGKGGLCALVLLTVLTSSGASAHGAAAIESKAAAPWAPSTAPLPTTLPSGQAPGSTVLYSTSCSSASFCVAVGFVQDVKATGFPLVETFNGTTWTASVAPEPSNAAHGGAGELTSVSCAADGICAAVGTMLSCTPASSDCGTGQPAHQNPLLETLSGGVWSASEGDLPGGPDSAAATLEAVSCGSTTSCVGVGADPTNDGQNGLIYTVSGGSWTMQIAPFPSDGMGAEYLTSVSCSDSADCLAVGTYPSSISPYEPLVLTLASGTWTAAQPPVPADAATTQVAGKPYPGGQLYGVSCPLPSYCVAGGYFVTSSYSQVPLFVVFDSGTVTATGAPTPRNARVRSNGAAWVTSISCYAASTCTAVGTYQISESATDGDMVLDLSAGTWTALPTSPSAKAKKTGKISFLHGVSCVSSAFCRAVGTKGKKGLIESKG